MKTKQEIDDLKANWKADPCWDIADTEGFEEHAEELQAYQDELERKSEEDYKQRVTLKAEKLNCSFETASYFIRLEQRIEYLEMRK